MPHVYVHRQPKSAKQSLPEKPPVKDSLPHYSTLVRRRPIVWCSHGHPLYGSAPATSYSLVIHPTSVAGIPSTERTFRMGLARRWVASLLFFVDAFQESHSLHALNFGHVGSPYSEFGAVLPQTASIQLPTIVRLETQCDAPDRRKPQLP